MGYRIPDALPTTGPTLKGGGPPEVVWTKGLAQLASDQQWSKHLTRRTNRAGFTLLLSGRFGRPSSTGIS